MRKKRYKIEWTAAMLAYMRKYFPTKFNYELVEHLHVSTRSVVRKARELHLEKEPGFLDKNRELITKMAAANIGRPPDRIIALLIEGGKATRFKAGQPNYTDRIDHKKCWEVRRRNAAEIQEAIKYPYGRL